MNDNIKKPPIATTVTGSKSNRLSSKSTSKSPVKSISGNPPADMPIAKKEPLIGPYLTVKDAYENSGWFRSFFFEIFEMYGCPVSILECLTHKDKILLSWAVLHITQALKQEPELWISLFEVDDPVMTADFFCRSFYEKRKEHVIPTIPEASPPPAIMDDIDMIKIPPRKNNTNEE